MIKYTLHSYRRCPFCIRVRILLYLKGFAYDVIEEPLRRWSSWMHVWTKETGERPRVPVLRYRDDAGIDQILPESTAINLFLDTADGVPRYTPLEGSPAYVEMLEWIAWHDRTVKPAIDLYKYGENRTFNPEKNQMHIVQLGTYLTKIETQLRDHNYLVEGRLTLADIAIIPFIRQIKRTRDGEFDFTSFPAIVAWTNSILGQPWFETQVMKKYSLAPEGQI